MINSCRYIRNRVHYVKFNIWLLSAVSAVIFCFFVACFFSLLTDYLVSEEDLDLLVLSHVENQ